MIHLHEKYDTNSSQMQITIVIIFWAIFRLYNSHKIISTHMNKPCSWSSLSFCSFWASVILWKSLEAKTAFFPNSLCIAMMASSATCPSFKSQILNPYFCATFLLLHDSGFLCTYLQNIVIFWCTQLQYDHILYISSIA